MTLVYVLAALAAGAVLCYLVMRERIHALHQQALELDGVRTENTRLVSALGEMKGRLSTVESAKGEMAVAFRAASSEALTESNRQFLDLAQERFERLNGDASGTMRELVKPLRDALDKVERQVQGVERDRIGSYSLLTGQVASLEVETRKLAVALSSPTARGRWGEIQLRRVVELAGMIEYCDFAEQTGITGAETRMRPDLVIQLPNEKQIVVDAKVPLTAYLAACELTDESARKGRLEEHAKQIRMHMKMLSSKAYSAQLACSPEFVVAFLPGEVFFSAALQVDGELLEFGVQNNVILATPTTLIALLKAVAYGWKQEQLARNAQEIRKLGAELYDRVRVFANHYEDVGKSLRGAVQSYDKGRTSLETRLLATARKFEELGVAQAGALPQPLPFTGSLGFGIDDEGRGNTGGSGEAAAAGSA
jgi:DNA recombination protein RmuC